FYESSGEWTLAIERYRRIIARVPDHVLALNNLAYTLATQQKNPSEALPFAKRAYALAKTSPAAADTLAWVYHLLGNDLEALPLITAAVKEPTAAEIHLHAAMIMAAAGNAAEAS